MWSKTSSRIRFVQQGEFRKRSFSPLGGGKMNKAKTRPILVLKFEEGRVAMTLAEMNITEVIETTQGEYISQYTRIRVI